MKEFLLNIIAVGKLAFPFDFSLFFLTSWTVEAVFPPSRKGKTLTPIMHFRAATDAFLPLPPPPPRPTTFEEICGFSAGARSRGLRALPDPNKLTY